MSGLRVGKYEIRGEFFISVSVEHHSYNKKILTHFYQTHHRMWLKISLLALSTTL
jgi:hypothetical protein